MNFAETSDCDGGYTTVHKFPDDVILLFFQQCFLTGTHKSQPE
ncbi:10896_t:CDS:1, partial [Gigaspora margarita]